MKSTPFFAGIGLAALLSSCSVYHSAPIDLNAEEASWKEASSVDSPTSITQNQARPGHESGSEQSPAETGFQQ